MFGVLLSYWLLMLFTWYFHEYWCILNLLATLSFGKVGWKYCEWMNEIMTAATLTRISAVVQGGLPQSSHGKEMMASGCESAQLGVWCGCLRWAAKCMRWVYSSCVRKIILFSQNSFCCWRLYMLSCVWQATSRFSCYAFLFREIFEL